MKKSFLKTGALLGALAVIFGAFGAHSLKQVYNGEGLAIFETATRYQFYHVFALLLTGMLYKEFANKFIVWAGNFFIAGILLFSGSLFLLSYVIGTGVEGLRWTGAITPLGGIAFILGWISLFAGIVKNK